MQQMMEHKSTVQKVADLLLAFAFVFTVAMLISRHMAHRTESSKRQITVERIIAIEDALARYMIDSGGMLPTGGQGLAALLEEPEDPPVPASWAGPYVSSEADLKDGWGREFQYLCPGRQLEGYEGIHHPFSLWSCGEDGAEGGKESNADICSWDRTTMITQR
jgi:general secretion pathway protein G